MKKLISNKKLLLIAAIILIVVIVIAIMLSKTIFKNNMDNPDINDVANALKNIDGISDICIVTEDNDPNGNLGKQGGYTGALYFVYDKAPEMTETLDEESDSETVEYRQYKDTCEKGTDAGGSIEIYNTVADAEARDTYLGTFDGTSALSSGSHTISGTVLIRTSSELKASEQKALENKIIEELNKNL